MVALPTQAELRRMFHYDPGTGVLVWRFREDCPPTWNFRYPGTVAGTRSTSGHITVWVHGRARKAHRLIWVYVYGAEPKAQIDHRNGVRDDNRLINLREATPGQNAHNAKARASLWPKGVRQHPNGTFYARIMFEGRRKHLGMFATAEAAHAAYCSAAKELFGSFARAA